MSQKADAITLSDEKRREVFKNEILPQFVGREKGAPLPAKREAVILGGQPGCGKTGLLEQAQKELSQRGATWVINGDDFYAYHPKYAGLQKAHGIEAPHLVKDDAKAWVAMTVDAARKRGVNIVLESTMRQPDVVIAQMQDFKQSGYTVQARVLAVKEQESWQSNHIRHEGMAESGGYRRFTSRATHDAAVVNMPKTLSAIEAAGAAERVTVYRRDGSVVHDSQRDKTPAADAVIKERSKPFSVQRVERHTANWNVIEGKATARHQRENVPQKRAAQEMVAIRTQRQLDERALNAERDRAATKPAQARDRGHSR